MKSAGNEEQGRSSRGQLWCFRVLALVAIPLVVLGALEGGLRLAGYGYNTAFLIEDEHDSSLLRDNRVFFWRFFPKALARTAQPIRVAKQTSEGTFRILLVGGSAAMGDPEPAYGPARMLEVMLKKRYQERDFEVINAAVTAINSHVVLPIVRDCLQQLKPDAVIVYMGNNEVHGPFGCGTVFGAQAPSMWRIRLGLALKTSKIGQCLASLTNSSKANGVPENWGGLEMFLDQRVAWGDAKLERVYAHFERNLKEIIDVVSRHQVPLLVSTVAVNLEDSPPFLSLPESEAQKRFDEGAYAKARDLDALRLRADSRINGIIEKVSKADHEGEVIAVNAAERFAAVIPDGIPGERLFWEHVHLSFGGAHLLAQVFGDGLAQTLSGDTEFVEWASLSDCLQELGMTSLHHRNIVSQMRARLSLLPFSNQLGHEERDQRLENLEDRLSKKLLAQRPEPAMTGLEQLIDQRPTDWMLRSQLAALLSFAGKSEEATAQWQTVTNQVPHHTQAWIQLGNQLNQSGKWQEAVSAFRRALELHPNHLQGMHDLAVCLANQKVFDEAFDHFEKVTSLMPAYVEAHVSWALVLSSQGKSDEAEARFQVALKHAPDDLSAHFQLGQHYLREQNLELAEKHHREVVRLAPEDVQARMDLARLCMQQNHVAAGIEELERVIQLDPKHIKAQTYLDQARKLLAK